MEYQPLADRIRPQSLDEVVGQHHILGRDGLLRRMIESGTIPNMVFYGPSGTGKTTVAHLIAQTSGRPMRRLNATTASLADLREMMDEVGTLMAPNGVLLYLDEIQYFNRKQQQALLEWMETGKMTLIATTTENPFFYVFHAVLSRSTVFEFKPLKGEEILPAVERALKLAAQEREVALCWEKGVTEHLAFSCGGDVRKAINGAELLFHTARVGRDGLCITLADARQAACHTALRYDREGDEHHDIASALMKSLRGSDPDGALHYLARLLAVGDLITAIRRLLCSASEDVGMAYPQAVALVRACCDNALQLGLPEARLPLAQAAILLATAPKSNSVYEGIMAAEADVQAYPIPRHLQNRHSDGTQEQGYLYPHDYPRHWVAQQYLPDGLQGRVYYRYGDNKHEQAARAYWENIRKQN